MIFHNNHFVKSLKNLLKKYVLRPLFVFSFILILLSFAILINFSNFSLVKFAATAVVPSPPHHLPYCRTQCCIAIARGCRKIVENLRRYSWPFQLSLDVRTQYFEYEYPFPEYDLPLNGSNAPVRTRLGGHPSIYWRERFSPWHWGLSKVGRAIGGADDRSYPRRRRQAWH